MKSALLFFSLALFSFNLSAQDCSYAKKMKCSSYAKKHCNYSSAAMAASLDESVISVFDTELMQTVYMRKVLCESSGTVTYENVKFDHTQEQFVSDNYAKCDWKKCLKKKNCCIKPLNGASATAVAAVKSIEQKRT